MKKRTHKTGRLLGLLVLLVLQTACAVPRIWLPQTGQVLEWPSKEPLEGVVVLAEWRGDIPVPVDSMRICFHAETATTNKEGRYSIPFWAAGPKLIMNQRAEVVIYYKAGYKTSTYVEEIVRYDGSIRKVNVSRRDREKGLFYLERDDRPVSRRIKYLSHQSSGCGGSDGSLKNIYVLDKAVYEEAKRIAKTKDDFKWVKRFRESAAYSALYDKNIQSGPERDRLIEEFMKDNLK